MRHKTKRKKRRIRLESMQGIAQGIAQESSRVAPLESKRNLQMTDTNKIQKQRKFNRVTIEKVSGGVANIEKVSQKNANAIYNVVQAQPASKSRFKGDIDFLGKSAKLHPNLKVTVMRFTQVDANKPIKTHESTCTLETLMQIQAFAHDKNGNASDLQALRTFLEDAKNIQSPITPDGTTSGYTEDEMVDALA